MDEIDEDEMDEEDYWERFGEESQTMYEILRMERRYRARDSEESDMVVLFDNQFFILKAYADEPQGAYTTLEAAILAGELNHVYENTFQIDAPTLNDESLQELLYYAGNLKHTLIVNGKMWRAKAGRKLEPATEMDSPNHQSA